MDRTIQERELSVLNAAASTQVVATFACPVEIVGIKLVATAVGDANTAANVRVNRRTIAGNTSSGVTNAFAGTFTIPTNVAQGSVLYDSGFVALQELKLDAGDQLAFEAVNVSTNAYTLIPIVQFIRLNEEDANLTNGSAV